MTTQWTVPAYNMAGWVDEFLTDFITNYWNMDPRPAYPISDRLQDSTIRTSNPDAWNLILSRGDAEFDGDALGWPGPDTLAPFLVQVGGQTLQVDVDLPEQLDIPINVDDQTIVLSLALAIYLHNIPVDQDGDPLPIGNKQQCVSVAVANDSIVYTFLDVDSSGQWSIVLQLKQGSRFARLVSLIAEASLDSSCSCSTSGGGGGGGGGTGACTLCSCPEWRWGGDNPPTCANIRPPTQQLCGHSFDAHPGASPPDPSPEQD
jgi:hypothetical protein